ncbi:MAG TPA: glycosyl hydrolase [Chloroflexia bacterium]|nr:glycosyl hydrolase [Chloroflexia bacterium]
MSEVQNLEGLSCWRSIGPFRGGRVVAVAGSYDEPSTFYFGGAAGGVWKTIDAGIYWRNVSDGFFTTSAIGALAVAPSDSNVIYAGTGETTIRIDVSHGDGVYKSTDAGKTWTNIGLRDTRFIGKIRVHPQNPDIVWVAALGHAFGPNKERGVFKSDDGGKNWRQVLFVSEKAGAVDLSVDSLNPRIIYATIWEAYRNFHQISSGGPDSGLWMSKDGGETWENISTRHGLPKGILGKIGVAASPARAGRVWALIEHKTEGGLYRSDDYGDTWERVSDNQNLVSRAWYYTHITADPQDGDTIYVNNLSFYRSTDGGKTFNEIPTPHGDNHDLWIDPTNNQRMIQGNDGGANVSLNGGFTFSSIYNQPTAQFYHLATDNLEPYNVYGTQQDNSSIAVPSRSSHTVISWFDCYVAGTGESGYIAVRPDDPNIVYVGAIGSSPGGGNQLQRYDKRTEQIRLITTWPELMSGQGAEDYKYRFAWTYPIVISPHNPNNLYIGGNMVFRTTDEGQTWEIISPDLTRADPETLKPTGGPINRDAVGAEVYATVFAFAESPLQEGLFWAGSDDGLVHISRNGGKDWQKITPQQLPEWTLISCIEPSPYDPAVAYLAGTRYKLDDYKPYLYVTRDYGQTWQEINNGIGEQAFTRVIRVDPVQPGLLYAGTETGIYVSFNDGQSWQSLQLNLPVTPVFEILVKGSDLIAGTHGRAIWILDDLQPLRNLAKGISAEGNYLFAPRETIRVLPGIEWSEPVESLTNYFSHGGGAYIGKVTPDGEKVRHLLDAGENPPGGVIVNYRLEKVPEQPITLSFRNDKGEEIASFSSRKSDDPTKVKEQRAPAKEGWNRFVWNMRHSPVTKIEGSDPPAEATVTGPIVTPGSYKVILKVGEQEQEQSFKIVKPSNLPATQEDLDAQYDLLLRIHRQLDRTAINLNRMRDLRSQLDGWTKRAKDKEGGAAIAEAAKALSEKVLEIEKVIQIPNLRSGWADNLNEGTRLLGKLTELIGAVSLGDYRPTAAAQAVFNMLQEKIEAQISSFEELTRSGLADFNKRLTEANFAAVLV